MSDGVVVEGLAPEGRRGVEAERHPRKGFDIFDVLVFLNAFSEGCPGQFAISDGSARQTGLCVRGYSNRRT